jgi:hypothetical protein
MEKPNVKECKEKISKEIDSILRYVGGFEVHSAKDMQALVDIQSMLSNVNAAVVKIEESHQRRIHLTMELSKTLKEIEAENTKFAEKHRNVAPE